MKIVASLYQRFTSLVHELAKFGVIGVLNFVITIGISDTLHFGFRVGPLTAFGVGTVIATTFSYFANRYWTFRHRDTTGLGREYVLFFVFNGVGLFITWVFIGVTHYVLGIQNGLGYNASQVVGTGVATLFRFWAYKKWVFLPPTLPPVDPHTGLPEPAGSGPDSTREGAAGQSAGPVGDGAESAEPQGPVAAGQPRRAR